MSCCRVFRKCIVEDSPFLVRTREVALDQTVVTAPQISAIAWKVFKPDNTIAGSGSLTPAAVITALQPWEKDDIGFNFAHPVPGTAFPEPPSGDQLYRLEYLFTPAGVGALPYIASIWDLEVEAV